MRNFSNIIEWGIRVLPVSRRRGNDEEPVHQEIDDARFPVAAFVNAAARRFDEADFSGKPLHAPEAEN